jgi:DNA-binding NtrC family response regulator
MTYPAYGTGDTEVSQKPAAADSPVRVLVVEDEDAIRSLLEEYLTMIGYDVAVASSARQALDVMRATRPEIVLLDIRMPGEMRGDQALPYFVEAGCVVLVVSGSIDLATEPQLLEAGAFEFIAKPFDLNRLTTSITAARRALPSRAA